MKSRAVPIRQEEDAGFASPENGFPSGPHMFDRMVGRSPAMRRLFELIRRYSRHLTVATIEGEPGTGKKSVARAIHRMGFAASGCFAVIPARSLFAVNEGCGDGLGRGSKLIEQARGGLLYLDRLDELCEQQQAALIRLVDQVHCQRSASGHPAVPLQMLFSLCSELEDFPDLVARLGPIRFRLPPLRERREDIPLLAQAFVQRFSRNRGKPVRGLGSGTAAPLLRYSWPGNISELEEVISTAAGATETEWIRPKDLPPLGVPPMAQLSSAPDLNTEAREQDMSLDRAIRDHVNEILQRTGGNKLKAAKLMGISRSTLYRILAADKPAVS